MSLAAANVSATLPTNYEYYTAGGIKQGLNADQPYFTLNDKLVRIYGGAMHYFRIPRVHWRDRLRKIRAAGLNTVETTVPWNLHEPESGRFDFGNGGSDLEDFLHLEEFLNIAKEEDLFVILRPGPFTCAEFNFGGFPSWLLREKTMAFRTAETTFMKYVTRYFNVLLTLLAAFQFTQGGPVIAFQVENEYGNQDSSTFQPDKVYLEELRQLYLKNGIVELLVTSDSPINHGDKGTLPGVFLQTANCFEAVEAQLNKLEELQPGRPLMVMEFWAGWFDYWAANHTKHKTAAKVNQYLSIVLDRNASFNTYMFVGGTNFDFNNGATYGSTRFETLTTSYGYDASIGEDGKYDDKYYAFREMLIAANPVKTFVPDVPELVPLAVPESVKIEKALPFQKLIEINAPYTIQSHQLVSMEKLDINNGSGQNRGYILYRKENVSLPAGSVLTIEGKVHDHALVLVNDKLIAPKQLALFEDLFGFGYAELENSTLVLNEEPIENATLDILVENMGRVNGGRVSFYNHSFKGLWEGNVTINGDNLYDWFIVPLEFRRQWVNDLEGWQNFSGSLDEPALYSSVFYVNDTSKDTFVATEGWGKGAIFVNGFNLGRYADVGPQVSLYLPSSVLQEGENKIVFFEEFYVPEDGLIQFADELLFKTVH